MATPLTLPDGKRVVVLLNIAYECWSEGVAPALGPMGNPLSDGVFDTQAASWGDYGFREGIWRLLRTLDAYDLRSTVFASGRLADIAPDSLRAAHGSGHEIAAHSYAQDVIPARLSEVQERANLESTLDLLRSVVGDSVHGWLSPRCTPSPATPRLLKELGLRWFSDVFDRDVPYLTPDTGDLVWLPFTMDVNDLPSYMRHGQQPRQLLETFQDTLRWLDAREPGYAHLDVTVHAHVFGRPFGAWVLDEICETVTGREDVWVPTRNEYAEWFLARRTDTA